MSADYATTRDAHQRLVTMNTPPQGEDVSATERAEASGG